MITLKKYLSIILLTIYLFSFQESRQLLKLPNLIEHFVENQGKYPTISFSDFICFHYFKENTKDADYKEDMKLPFKNYDFSASHFTLALPSFIDYDFQKNQNFYIQKNQNFSYKNNPVREHYYSIFQPPEFLLL